MRGEGWSSILLLQVPKYQWFGSGTPTYVSPFQPYTLQLSPLMCRLHTIPHFLSQKKKNFFFIRTFVFCNVPHGVSVRSNMGCYAIAYWNRVERIFLMAASRSCHYNAGTGDVWEIYRPSPRSARDLRPVMAQ